MEPVTRPGPPQTGNRLPTTDEELLALLLEEQHMVELLLDMVVLLLPTHDCELTSRLATD